MKSKSKVLISCMVILGVNAFASKVSALDFNFTFTGNAEYPGQVSGVIKGLADTGRSTPTEITVFANSPQTGTDNIVFTFPPNQQNGEFTVSNGNITEETNYYAFNDQREYIVFNYGAFANEFFDGNSSINNESGFSGVTYTPAATAVPWEFSPVQGAALGLPLFIGLRMLKRKIASKRTTSKFTKAIS